MENDVIFNNIQEKEFVLIKTESETEYNFATKKIIISNENDIKTTVITCAIHKAKKSESVPL